MHTRRAAESSFVAESSCGRRNSPAPVPWQSKNSARAWSLGSRAGRALEAVAVSSRVSSRCRFKRPAARSSAQAKRYSLWPITTWASAAAWIRPAKPGNASRNCDAEARPAAAATSCTSSSQEPR